MDEVEDLFAIRGDAKAMEFWDWPHDRDVSCTALASETFLQDMQAERALYWTARTADGEFAGIFDLSEWNDDADLGFMVPCLLWGNGYGFEGATALVNEAWRRGHPTLGARIHDGNYRSARATIIFRASARARAVIGGCGEPKRSTQEVREYSQPRRVGGRQNTVGFMCATLCK